jgi:hypothetical protein
MSACLRFRLARTCRLAPAAVFFLLLAGCVTERGAGDDAAPGSGAGGAGLSARLVSRWSAPDFATRVVDAERDAVFGAAIATANALGYSVHRTDGSRGRIAATRRQRDSFGEAREDTLEINVTPHAPGSAQVALSLRELVESGGGDERSGGIVTTSRVRERAPYDAFFDRLAVQLGFATPTP